MMVLCGSSVGHVYVPSGNVNSELANSVGWAAAVKKEKRFKQDKLTIIYCTITVLYIIRNIIFRVMLIQ